MLETRVLRVRLDPLERRFVSHSLDLELGDEDRELTRSVRGDGDGALRCEELEGREIADVVLTEEHEAGETVALEVLEQAPAARLELVGRDTRGWAHGVDRSPFERLGRA